jgi:transposase
VFEALPENIMWTPTTRAHHSRAGLRYGSDVTDAEWEVLAPFLPPPSRHGRHRKWDMREIVNAIFYALRAGCAWSLLPKCFAPWPTVYRWFARFRDDGTWEAINHHLVMLDRERVGREASPTAAVIDSQSVKTTESGAPSRSWMAAEWACSLSALPSVSTMAWRLRPLIFARRHSPARRSRLAYSGPS